MHKCQLVYNWLQSEPIFKKNFSAKRLKMEIKFLWLQNKLNVLKSLSWAERLVNQRMTFISSYYRLQELTLHTLINIQVNNGVLWKQTNLFNQLEQFKNKMRVYKALHHERVTISVVYRKPSLLLSFPVASQNHSAKNFLEETATMIHKMGTRTSLLLICQDNQFSVCSLFHVLCN